MKPLKQTLKGLQRILLMLCLYTSVHAAPDFLTISDIHYGSANSSGDGNDTGPEFLKITMEKYQQLSKQVNFILFLGDIPTHSLFNLPEKGNFEKLVFQQLYEHDVSRKPIFYIAGNNDSLQGNYQPFEVNGISPLNFAPDWRGACAHCKGLMIDDSHMQHDGYYSSYVMPKNKNIILIALNATQWTIPPIFVNYPNQEHDALIQLAWLKHQLKTHHAQQLLIAMHEPPGMSFRGKPIWYESYLNEFKKILNEYQKYYGEITLLTSHTHMEEFRRIRLDNGRMLYAFSTPGISRIHRNYPAMKIFKLNKHLQMNNFTTYFTSESNLWKNQQYQAISDSGAIFPFCSHNTLTQCLNQLSEEQICYYLNKDLFYAVKSPTVPDQHCDRTIRI